MNLLFLVRASLCGTAAFVYIAILSGCAPLVWTKPGGAQSDFAEDRYACLQEAQQREARAQVGRFGGSAIDSVQTNTGLFGACMNARGWYLGRESFSSESGSRWNQTGWMPPPGIGVYSTTEADTRSKAEAERQKASDRALNVARARLSLICYDLTQYKQLWVKGACQPDAITANQLADGSKATQDEIRLMRVYVSEIIANTTVVAEADRASGNLWSVKAIESARDAVVLPANGLIDGSMTWGMYNTARAKSSR